MIGGHEDHEQELGIEALGEPRDDLDLLRGRPADEVEVELVVRERKAVVQRRASRAALQLGAELARVGQPLLAGGRVEAGEREPVHLRRWPGEGTLTIPVRRPEGGSRSQTAGALRKLPLTSRSW